MNLDFPILLAAALVPLLIGFFWYNPKTFGTVWMNAAGLTEEKLKGANMAVIFIMTYIFSVFIAMTLNMVTIHQWGLMSLLAQNPDVNVPGTPTNEELKNLLNLYGDRFRTFKHGALHGFISSLFFALPLIGVNALFERRGWKYIWIHTGFWALCFLIMGGIICQFSHVY